MPTCTVTGTLRNSSGVALPNTPVSFLRGGVFAQAGAVILERLPTTVSDAFGEIEIELLPGNYLGIALDYKGTRDGFAVAVPEAATADLAAIINDQVAITPTLLAQAIAARDEATAAAASSSGDAAAVSAALATASAIVGSGNGRFPNGTAALPSIAFAGDTDTGFFRSAANTIGAVTGGVTRWLLSTTELVVNVPITGTAVTQSATDTTAGRLMKVGDFGLGGIVPRLMDISVTDNSIATGLYVYDTSLGSVGGPVGVTRANLIHMRRAFGGGECQILIPETGAASSNGGIFSRSRTTFGWLDWRLSYNSGNILGTVSQSGGVPTGAIIERGNNANGQFVRYADGTQICNRKINLGSAAFAGAGTFDDPFRTDTFSVFFPAAFAFAPDVSMLITTASTTASDRRLFGISGAIGTSNVAVVQAIRIGTSNNASDVTAHITAVGRWF